jgi:hypothetical protein
MSELTYNEKVIIDKYFISNNIVPNQPEFVSALCLIMPEHRVYEILGHDFITIQNWKPTDKCIAYENYIEEIFSGKI